MSRPRKNRIVEREPDFDYFLPKSAKEGDPEEVILSITELECVRLSGICKLNQTQCAQKMGIHQSTFFRMLDSAREKIADALVNGKAIRIKGGNYILQDNESPKRAPCCRGRGSPGRCVCPDCGYSTEHERGKPCALFKCPECGRNLVRE